MRSSRYAAVLAGLLALLLPQAAAAVSFVNPSLEGTPGQALVPPGWTQFQGNTTDTADANGPFGTYNLSPDGGTFARSFSYQKDTSPVLFNQREGLEQTVAGLAVGTTYEISFFQSSLNAINASSGIPFSGAAGFWTLTVDGAVADTGAVIAPPAGTSQDNVWSTGVLRFTATVDTHLLSFLATVPDAAAVDTRTFLGIDGLGIQAVPEPAAGLLVALGLALVRRRLRPTGA